MLMQLNEKRFRVFPQPDFYAIAVVTDIAVKISLLCQLPTNGQTDALHFATNTQLDTARCVFAIELFLTNHARHFTGMNQDIYSRQQ
ncbi:hypothetical protein ACVXHA_03515 [Escherichia coli]